MLIFKNVKRVFLKGSAAKHTFYFRQREGGKSVWKTKLHKKMNVRGMLKEKNNKLFDMTPFKYKTKTHLISDCFNSHLEIWSSHRRKTHLNEKAIQVLNEGSDNETNLIWAPNMECIPCLSDCRFSIMYLRRWPHSVIISPLNVYVVEQREKAH